MNPPVQQLERDGRRKAQQAAVVARFLPADIKVAPINGSRTAGGEREKCGSTRRNGCWGEGWCGAGQRSGRGRGRVGGGRSHRWHWAGRIG